MTPTTADLSLLEKTQALIAVERSLTETMEKVEPWLKGATHGTIPSSSTNRPQFMKRVRPLPTTMEQVHQVLAVSRNFASRTSAPAGWNPNAPVVGFSTPNPLPHQLRGGALAALQLERARQAERDKKRRLEAEKEEVAAKEEEAAKEQRRLAEAATSSSTAAAPVDGTANRNPKSRRTEAPPQTAASSRPRTNRPPQQQAVATTMNLSDSSSSDDDDDDDDDSS